MSNIDPTTMVIRKSHYKKFEKTIKRHVGKISVNTHLYIEDPSVYITKKEALSLGNRAIVGAGMTFEAHYYEPTLYLEFYESYGGVPPGYHTDRWGE